MELKDKAIYVIEELSCRDDFAPMDTEVGKVLSLIFKFSHIARGECTNPHAAWVKELEELWQILKGNNE